MRLIDTFNNEDRAIGFSQLLTQNRIEHKLEVLKNTDWGSPHYGSTQFLVWIYDEDQLNQALQLAHEFAQIRLYKDMESSPPIRPNEETIEEDIVPQAWKKMPLGPITRFLLIGCTLLFFISQFQIPINEEGQREVGLALFSSPLEKTFLFDFPYTYQLIDQFIQQYGYKALENPKNLPPEAQSLFYQIEHTPFWTGLYTIIEKQGVGSLGEKTFDIPMFEKIKEGEVWRLISPIFLHIDLFHLFFNMLWLFVLGKQIELRLGIARYLFFIGIIAIPSNIVQYIVGGPNFIGFSGVLAGMLAYIWLRQHIAPWEGYQLDRLTILFIVLFIALMAFLQLVAFFVGTFSGIEVTTGIANTAHLTGAAIGLLLGKMSYFSWRPS